ncbi:unnamed protein product [Ilex paraguariensis]|uniref:Uncharacterized protein n=1 Tax=Ilex paraguariensis TaxID=185542 RepID=A0ABC8UZZ6_9AQUA
MFVGFSWYMKCESLFEGLFDQIILVLMVSPLLLLLAVHLLSSFVEVFVLHILAPAGLSSQGWWDPLGCWGCFFVLLFFMISYQSDFRDRWFPLNTLVSQFPSNSQTTLISQVLLVSNAMIVSQMPSNSPTTLISRLPLSSQNLSSHIIVVP